jgi:hypothetical protein
MENGNIPWKKLIKSRLRAIWKVKNKGNIEFHISQIGSD